MNMLFIVCTSGEGQVGLIELAQHLGVLWEDLVPRHPQFAFGGFGQVEEPRFRLFHAFYLQHSVCCFLREGLL